MKINWKLAEKINAQFWRALKWERVYKKWTSWSGTSPKPERSRVTLSTGHNPNPKHNNNPNTNPNSNDEQDITRRIKKTPSNQSSLK